MKIKTGLATGMMAVNEQSGTLLSGARYDQVTRADSSGGISPTHIKWNCRNQLGVTSPTGARHCNSSKKLARRVKWDRNRIEKRTHRPEAPKPKAARTPTKKAKPAKRRQQAEDGTRQQESRSDSV